VVAEVKHYQLLLLLLVRLLINYHTATVLSRVSEQLPCYYKSPYLFYISGKIDEANRIVSHINKAFMQENGDLTTSWEFRVLFRSIMSRERRGRRKRYAHIAVQIDPEEGRIQEPERARRYLENYFDDADISIYWGSAEEFIKELYKKMESD
jgi:hypothetical protein